MWSHWGHHEESPRMYLLHWGTEEQCIYPVSRPTHWPDAALGQGCYSLALQSCACLTVADGFAKHPMPWWQKILKGLVFPETERERFRVSAEVNCRQVTVRWSLQQWPEYKMGWKAVVRGKRGVRYREVVYRKSAIFKNTQEMGFCLIREFRNLIKIWINLTYLKFQVK